MHAMLSIGFGLIGGVLLPTLPNVFGGPLLFRGGLILPLLWSGVNHSLMGLVNPLLNEYINWPWYVVSQIVYGLATSIVIIRSEKSRSRLAAQVPMPVVPQFRPAGSVASSSRACCSPAATTTCPASARSRWICNASRHQGLSQALRPALRRLSRCRWHARSRPAAERSALHRAHQRRAIAQASLPMAAKER